MGISIPGQIIPSLPFRDSIDESVSSNGLFGSPAVLPPWASGVSSASYGQRDTQLGCVTVQTNVVVGGINLEATPFVFQWFEQVDVEWYWYLPVYGDGAASVVGAGMSNVLGGSPCSGGNVMNIQAGQGGTTCTGAINAGVWHVMTGKVATVVRFNTVHSFTTGRWYKCNIQYNKNPLTLDYLIDDVPIVDTITNPNSIPDNIALSFVINYAGSALNSAQNFFIDYLKISTVSAPREPL